MAAVTYRIQSRDVELPGRYATAEEAESVAGYIRARGHRADVLAIFTVEHRLIGIEERIETGSDIGWEECYYDAICKCGWTGEADAPMAAFWLWEHHTKGQETV